MIELKYKTKPFEHQKKVTERFFNEILEKDISFDFRSQERTFFDCDAFALFMEMGTGKTKVAIDIASNLFLQDKIDAVLLVAPNGIQRQWLNEQVPLHSVVPTENLLWKNSSSAIYLQRFFEFSGKKEYFAEEKTPEQEMQIENEKEAIDELFDSMFSDEPQEIKQEEKFSSVDEVSTTKCLKWLYVNIDRFSVNGKTKAGQMVLQKFIEFLKDNRILLIIDESTRIKNINAKRTSNLINLGKLAKYRLILTGEPITNSPFDIYAQMEFLYGNFWNCNYFIFQNRYGMFVQRKIEVQGKNGYTIEKTYKDTLKDFDFTKVRSLLAAGKSIEDIHAILKISESTIRYIQENPTHDMPFKNLDEVKGMVKPFSFTIKSEDCLDLPEKIYQIIPVEMNKEQDRIYKELEKEYLANYDGDELSVQHKMTLSLRLQQVTGGFFPIPDPEHNVTLSKMITTKNPKIERLKEEIEEAGKKQIIIWARFRSELMALKEQLTKSFPFKRVELYFGDTHSIVRDQYKQEFQDGLIDILVINQATGALGLNLQRGHIQFFFSNDFSYENRAQAEKRTHRMGQSNNCIYKDFVIPGTIDMKILKALRTKKSLAQYFKEDEQKWKVVY